MARLDHGCITRSTPCAATYRTSTPARAGERPRTRAPAARWLIAVLLLAAAALDLTRCGLVLASARHLAFAGGLVAAGLAAAAVSIWTARACLSSRQWPSWAALLIGAASAPQAAASGFGAPYTIPDAATAAFGVLLAVAVLATAGPPREDNTPEQSAFDEEATP
jgi:hypothetical protein